MKKVILVLTCLLLVKAVGAQSIEPAVENPTLIVDKVECEGNQKTQCEFITAEVYLQLGQPFIEEEIENAKLRLKLKNLFESVNIYLKKANIRNHIIVIIEVVEKNSNFQFTEFNHWKSSEGSSSKLEVNFGNRNLFGLGKSLIGTIGMNNIEGENNQNISGGISYLDPHILGAKNYFFAASLKSNKSNNRFVDENSSIYSFNHETVYALSVGRRLFDFSYFSLGTTVDSYEMMNNNSDKLTSNTKTHTMSYGWNTEDDVYFATTGDKFQVNYSEAFSQNTKLSDMQMIHYEKNFRLSNAHSFLLGGRVFGHKANYEYDGCVNCYSVNSAFDLKYNYQLFEEYQNKEKWFQRGKLYYGLSPSFSESYNFVTHEVGFVFDSKNLGIIKISLSLWNLL